MKTLLLIRHAKSSWDSNAGNDFDRPLNDRGKRDAPEMARRLLRRNIKIDRFVSSPANRAKKTALLFAHALNFKEDKIIFIPELYHAHSDSYHTIIPTLDDSAACIAIFSHNPGITDFANSLTDTRVDDMPTCSIFSIQIDTLSWSEFSKAQKKFYFFDYPKSGHD